MAETPKTPTAPAPAATPGPAAPAAAWHPFAALRTEMDRLFDNFWPGTAQRGPDWPASWRGDTAFGLAAPDIDIVEDDKAYRIQAELPGLDAKDVEIDLANDILTLKGEKKESREEKRDNYHLSERRFGSFRRSFRMPQGVDRAAIAAAFDKGVLTITLPKTAEAAETRRRIEIAPQ